MSLPANEREGSDRWLSAWAGGSLDVITGTKSAEITTQKKIKEIKISIGGYHQGFQEFHINLKDGRVCHKPSLYEDDSLLITLSTKLLEKFKNDLIGTSILNWRRRYDNNDILDGTQWEIVLVRDGRNIIRSGSNDYPKEWENFCKIISEISGRDFS